MAMSSARTGSANTIGALWLLAGTALFTIIFASAKFAGSAASVPQLLMLRYIGGLGTLLAPALFSPRPLTSYRSRQPGQHFLRASLGALGGLAAIYAAAHMPVAAASAIGLLEGLIVTVLAIIMLGEIVGWRHWLAGLLCATGALCVVVWQSPGAASAGGALFPATMALLGAILMAFESIFIKRLTNKDAPLAMLLHFNGFGCLLMLVPAVLTWREAGLAVWIAGLSLGPVALFAQYCNIRGFGMVDMAVAGPIGYAWIVFAALLGFLAFGETPGLGTLAGSLLILGGGLWLTCLPSTRRA
jgi:drug/metabolite transporter (DMT)-like permease